MWLTSNYSVLVEDLYLHLISTDSVLHGKSSCFETAWGHASPTVFQGRLKAWLRSTASRHRMLFAAAHARLPDKPTPLSLECRRLTQGCSMSAYYLCRQSRATQVPSVSQMAIKILSLLGVGSAGSLYANKWVLVLRLSYNLQPLTWPLDAINGTKGTQTRLGPLVARLLPGSWDSPCCITSKARKTKASRIFIQGPLLVLVGSGHFVLPLQSTEGQI
jgi:hypothetical protein